MTGTSQTDQLRALHVETVAAVQQRQGLAVAARCALIAALHEGLICRPGCEDALTGWGLEPPPQQWTIRADARLSFPRAHADDDEARAQARFGVPDELRGLAPTVAVYPQRVIDVAPVLDGAGQPGQRRYLITVQVALHTWVTATRGSDALEAARTAVQAHLPALAAAGITLTGLTWHDVDPDDAPAEGIPTPALSAAELASPADDLAAATATRDTAVTALTGLRRAIRTRAIRALVDDEISGSYQHTAQRVERFLVELGLDALPRAHHVTVTVELTVPGGDGTAQDAHDRARQLMRAVTTDWPDDARPWTADGGPIPEHATVEEGRWRIAWRHEYEMWLRGHPTCSSAATIAEAHARVNLARALRGSGHRLTTVTVHVNGVGVDLYLDPDRD
ncbi:hypothetical protein ACFOOK_02670 [Micromonospora krabiensis]|uniref:Uncharacterized protein n=1 Tax=Micromonospora krabiensis TaxID=307121 RepID=A0A1C3MWN2_9ACTN|nr:hypothetical protein [Micromonospora krabiensis]SBV24738.1 hypothetical protein GA0070620_0176 [Micromonospora krabiensis]